MSSSRMMTNGGVLSPRRCARPSSQASRGVNCNRRSSVGSGASGADGAPPETMVHPISLESASTRTAITMMPCNRETSYGRLSHTSTASASAQVRGTSRERGVRSASTGRGLRTPSCANCSAVSSTVASNLPVAETAPASSATDDGMRQTQWEEFAVHRHETQMKLQALTEARESQRLTDARAQLQVEQLSRTVEECVQDVQSVREQSDAYVERLTDLNRALESDREALETIRRGLGRLERALRDQVEQQEHHQEAVAATIKRGDRVVADELLAKMAELNEKLGANMQALEEEVTRDLQMMKEQLSEGHATSSTLAAAVATPFSAQSASDHSHIATAHISAAELSGMLEIREDTLSTAATYMTCGHSLPDSLAQEVQCQRARLEELDSKLAAETAIFKDSRLVMAQEQRNLSEQLREGLDDARKLCKHAEVSSRSSTQCMREELHARLDEARNAREDLAAAIEESLRELRDELQLKLDNISTDRGLSNCSPANETLESIEGVRNDLRLGLNEAWKAHKELALSVESSATELENIRTQVIVGLRNELAEQLDLVSRKHSELSASVDKDVSALHGVVEPLENQLADVRATCEQLSARAEAFSGFRVELAEQLDLLKGGHSDLAALMHKDLSILRAELGEGKSLSEYVADAANGAILPFENQLKDIRVACKDMSARAEDIDATKQRMQKFCEEIIEMIADINSQACCGCIEVQQSLEVAVERLNGSSDGVALRLQALEGRLSSSTSEEKTQIANSDAAGERIDGQESQGDAVGRMGALEARMEALSGFLSGVVERFEAWLQEHSNELATFPVALADSRGQLLSFQEQLEVASTSMQKDKVKFEQELGNHEARLEAVAATVGKMRAQLDMSEARLEAACKAAQNTSMNSSPIKWEREVSDCDLVTSPTTFIEAQGQVATLQERLEAVQETTRRQAACLDSRLEIVEAGLRALPTSVATMQSQLSKFEAQLGGMPEACKEAPLDIHLDGTRKAESSLQALHDSITAHDKELRAHAEALETLSESHRASPRMAKFQSDLDNIRIELTRLLRIEELAHESSLQDKFASLKEQFTAVQDEMSKERMQSDQRLETQAADIASIRRAVSDLTTDVLKTQGLADAAYAEATREQDWTSAVEASAEVVWKKHQSDRDEAWRVKISDAVQCACSKISGDLSEKTSSLTQQLRDELQQQCRKWIDELSHKAGKTEGSSHGRVSDDLVQALRQEWQTSLQEHCSEISRSQDSSQQALRSEIEQTRQEAQTEADRLWEAIGAQAGGVAERSEALALETQHQCRTWVDGALRKLEDLALRTKERIAALASAADRREERLEARLTAKLTDAGFLKSAGESQGKVEE